jgi:hypothetical protein
MITSKFLSAITIRKFESAQTLLTIEDCIVTYDDDWQRLKPSGSTRKTNPAEHPIAHTKHKIDIAGARRTVYQFSRRKFFHALPRVRMHSIS